MTSGTSGNNAVKKLTLHFYPMYNYSDVPESEKIDRTYKMLRSMQRSRWIGLFLRVFIVAGLWYGYHYLQMPEHAELKEKIKTEAKAKLSEFIVPLVQDMVGDILKNMQVPAPGGSVGAVAPGGAQPVATPTITPEMIRAVQDSMKK